MTKSRLFARWALAGLTALLLALAGAGSATAAENGPAVESRAPAVVLAESSCVPGQWTQVHWYVNPLWIANYRYQVHTGVSVKWRWFSGGIPPYWEGNFTTTGDIWTPPSWYTSVEFLCSSPSPVLITPV